MLSISKQYKRRTEYIKMICNLHFFFFLQFFVVSINSIPRPFRWYPQSELNENSWCQINSNFQVFYNLHQYSTETGKNLPNVNISYIQPGLLSISYEEPVLADKMRHLWDATYWDGTKCRLCPYQAIETMTDCDLPNIRACYKPMYAYCLDGELPRRLSCIQDPFIYPLEFYGEFYYPPQKAVVIPNYGDIGIPGHLLLQKESFTDEPAPNTPFMYGISKFNLRNEIRNFLKNPYVSDEDQPSIVKYFRLRYENDESWGLWGQKQCDSYCHRDHMFLSKYVTNNDFVNNEKLYFLNISYQDLEWRIKPEKICSKCFEDSDVAIYRDTRVSDPFLKHYENNVWFLGSTCIPWFGAIPLLSENPHRFVYTKRKLGSGNKINVEGMDVYEYLGLDISNSEVNVYNRTFCPVNHYNRICALNFQRWANDISTIDKVKCTACPHGYHTDNKIGSWFCLPPTGNYFVHNVQLNKYISPTMNISKIWARRDIIKYELECGILTSECVQCRNVSGAENLTPDQFNEKFIFDYLLEVKTCPANFYCPHPLLQPRQCPVGRCSPMNSSSETQCTCCNGYFLNLVTNQCEACKSPSMCGHGQYLAGYLECMYTYGPKTLYQGGICTNCSSKPLNSKYVLSHGIEIKVQGYGNVHFCPFVCDQGFSLKYPPGQQMSSACTRSYSCEPINALNALAPYQIRNNDFAYNSGLSSFTDKVILEEESCIFMSDFSTTYRLWINSISVPNVNKQCSTANPTQCGAFGVLCKVTVNATLFNDFSCQPCDLTVASKPENAEYYEEAVRGDTNFQAQSKHCMWKCNSGYYKNGTSCKSCSLLALEVCPNGFFIEGGGCLGNVRPLYERLSDNCVNCSKSLEQLSAHQYLDYTTCTVRNCSSPVIPFNSYIKRSCGLTFSDYVYDTCSVCSSSEYRAARCQDTSNTVCIPCTVYKAGFYKTANCTLEQDSSWTQCQEGFFCTGNGLRNECPLDMMSIVGSSSLSDCFCRIGLQLDSNGACIPKICPDSIPTYEAPSASDNIISPYYFYLDNLKQTRCAPCNVNTISTSHTSVSYARGDRIGIGSCKCPRSYYSNIAIFNDFSTNVTCSPCANRPFSSCLTSAFFIRTNRYCINGEQYGNYGCECILPPFTTKVSTSCSILGCIPGFTSYNAGSFSEIPSTSSVMKVTGSNIYTSKTIWSLGFDYRAFVIDKIRTSSDFMASEFQRSNLNYVFWNIKSGAFVNSIFVQSLNFNSESNLNPCLLDSGQCNPYTESRLWSVFCETDYHMEYIIADFVVAKWPNALRASYFVPNSAFPQLWTWIGVLIYSKKEMSYAVWTAKVMALPTQDLSIVFEQNGRFCGPTHNLNDKHQLDGGIFNDMTAVVGIKHAYSFPSRDIWIKSSNPSLSENRTNAFYIAYNLPGQKQCGILALLKTANTQTLHLNLSHPNKRQILAFTVVENFYESSGKGILLYVIYSDFFENSGIQLIKWTDTSMTRDDSIASVNTNTVELFFPSDIQNSRTKFREFSIAWPRNTVQKGIFLLLTDVYNSSFNTYQTILYTADGMQRTFTTIQGMPLYSSPTSVGVYEYSYVNAYIIAAGKSSLYSLEINSCAVDTNSPPKYFDGDVCKIHTCYRSKGCLESNNQYFNPNTLSCECSPGYYSLSSGTLSCVSCPANSYCTQNQRYACPSNLISDARSTAMNNCKCSDGNYFDALSNTCRACPIGTYCPNNWNKISCPGKPKIVASGSELFISPVSCTCDMGTEGASCSLCPEGTRCVPSTTSPNMVQNVAVLIHVKLKRFDDNTVNIVCSVFQGAIRDFFGQYPSYFSYFKQQETLIKRIYCTFIESPDTQKTPHMIALMIQIDQTDSVSGAIQGMFSRYQDPTMLNLISTPFQEYMEVLKVIPETQTYQAPFLNIFVQNSLTYCPVGQTSNVDRTQCECKPGYEYKTLTCRECIKGWYKSSLGMGLCQQCPIGKTTQSIGSISCVDITNSGENTVNSNSDGNMNIIIGSVVGGVVFIFLIIFGLYFFGSK